MTYDERDRVRDIIKQTVPVTQFLGEVNRSGFCDCPLCGSGTGINGKNTAALKVYPEANTYYCFSCDKGGDVISLYQRLTGSSYTDTIKALAPYAGIHLDEDIEHVKIPEIKPAVKHEEKPPAHADYKRLFSFCRQNVSKTDYFAKRGISADLVKRCGLGFNPSFEFRNDQTGQREKHPAVLIPYSRKCDYYFARATDGTRLFKKPSVSVAGPEPVWNEAALKGNNPVFVCESPIDALSVMQAGGTAVAVGGTGTPKLVKAIKDAHPQKPLILSLDNDSHGADAMDRLSQMLDKEGIPYIRAEWSLASYPPDAKTKDANEMLCSDARIFSYDVRRNTDRSMQRGAELNAEREIKQINKEMQTQVNQPMHTRGQTQIQMPRKVRTAEAVL